MSNNSEFVFGKFRSFFWPIHRYELRKFLPMLAILFLVTFNYSILRNMKDALVVTASGAEVIPFIKVWAMLPGAIFMTVFFTRLSSKYSQERVFYIMISIFLACFALFVFFLYPAREYIHPQSLAHTLGKILPHGFQGLIATMCNWSYTIFYVMCELWGSVVMSVIFWGFANEVTRLHEARRFYSVLTIFSNIATILAGQVGNFFTLETGDDTWHRTMVILIFIVIGCGMLIMALFRWMNKSVLNDPSFDELHHTKRELKKKGKMSMRESFTYLSKSKYLIFIACIVVAYSLTINLVEVVWKDRLRELYPNPKDLNMYFNNLTSATGLVSTVMAIFMSRIIYKYGWTKTALITPVTMLITCIGFFTFVIFENSLGPIALTLTGMTPLMIASLFGSAQNCFSKAMKYSVFDATKEMTLIPLDHEVKLRGKAAIDGVGSRLGKSGGSLIHQGLLLTVGSLSATSPIVAVIIIGVIVAWIISVRGLGVQFADLTRDQDKILAEGEKEKEKRAAASAQVVNA